MPRTPKHESQKDQNTSGSAKKKEAAEEHDARRDLDPKEHPHDDHGVSEEEDVKGHAEGKRRSRRSKSKGEEEHDKRHDFVPQEHPRDEHGRFIPKSEDASAHEHEGGKNQSAKKHGDEKAGTKHGDGTKKSGAEKAA